MKIYEIVIMCVASLLLSSCSNIAGGEDITKFSPDDTFQPPEELSLPIMSICLSEDDCNKIHASRDYKAFANCVILSSCNRDTLYEGEITIKTRGNSSWEKGFKKPYSISFPEKIKILNLYKGKKFILLSNCSEATHLRNALAFDMAHRFGIAAPNYEFIRVFVNGDYRGLYQMTNKIEPNKAFLPIHNLEKENKRLNGERLRSLQVEERDQIYAYSLSHNPENITGGYIIDHHGLSGHGAGKSCGFYSENGQCVRLKSPQNASFEEVKYLASIYNRIERALSDSMGIDPISGKHYSELIDIPSFISNYLINECMKNHDSGRNSFMLVKDINDEKIYASVIWDFDAWVPEFPNELIACARHQWNNGESSGGLFYYLWQHQEFRDNVRTKYLNEVHPYLDSLFQDGGRYDRLKRMLKCEADTDNERWNRWDGLYDCATDDLRSFLRERNSCLYWLWTTNPDSLICVHMTYEKDKFTTEIYGARDKGVNLSDYDNRRGYVVSYHITGDERIIPNDTVFYKDADITMNMRLHTWWEIHMGRWKQRIKKVLH